MDEQSDGDPSRDRSDGRNDNTVLRGDRLTLRPGRPDDIPALQALFDCAGVRRWWGSQDEDDIDEYVADSDPEVTALMVELDQNTVGMIQFHEETDPQYRHAGIDLAIHDDHQGLGLGPEAIRLVVDHLASMGHHRIVIDPNADNQRAIKAYQRVGFKAVGTMREYEWSESRQAWTDGLLMELLIRERPQ